MRQKKILVSMKALLLVVALWFACAAGALAQGIVEYSIILANRDNAETRVFTINLEIVGNEKQESISTVSQLESACNRETITEDILYVLDDNIETTSNFNVKKCLKLDLNGHSIKSSATECFNINDNAGLTIVDRSTGGQKGSINCSNEGTANAININNGAILIADGVTIKCAKGSAITNVSGKAKISGCTVSSAIGILNQGTTTVIGGSIEDYSVSGIKNAGGTVTLNAWPTFSPGSADGVSDIWLSQGNTITIGSAITAAPTNKISVRVTDNNDNDLAVAALPATITSGYATYVTDGSSNVIDPADVFTYYKSNPYIVVTLDAAPSSEAVLAEKPKEQTVYIDPTKPAGQQECTVNAYVLDGTETALGSVGQTTWYVCKTPVTDNDDPGLTYTQKLTLLGNVNLILADGCKMTVSGGNDNSIYIYQGSADNPNRLHIYGQGGTTEGKLTATSESGDAINGNFDTELIINGGIINATGSSGIKVTGSGTVTINGGNITATSIGNNAHPYGIYGSNGITINGGQVTATSTGGGYGIATTNSYITLGFSKTTDFIYANSYNTSSSNLVKTADGQRFAAYNMASEGDLSVSAIVSGSSKDSNPVSFTLDDIAGKTLRPIAVAETDAQGATTVSPGFLLSVTASGITPVGRTEPDFTLGTTPYYIYKAGTTDGTIPLSVTNYGQTGAEFTVSINGAAATTLPDAAVSISDGLATAAFPWEGANDVEIQSARYYCTGVDYLDWDDTQKKLVPATTSTASGAVTKVYILTGGTGATLPGGWYVVKNWNTSESNNSGIDAFYTGTVKFTGDTRLILADGAIMSIGTRNATINGNGIHFEPGSLTIYAQSTGPDMGTLNTFPRNGYSGIQALSSPSETCITINGGNITCESCNATGIEVWNINSDASITINGGKVTVTGTDMNNGILTSSYYNSSITINDGIVDLNVSTSGICVENTSSTNSTSTLSVLGGKVVDCSEHGFSSYSLDGVAEIILGWKNADDYIYAKKYDINGTVHTVSGQYLMACTDVNGTGTALTGTIDATGIGAITGKYLRPAMYTITAPENCNLSVADNVGTVDPVTVGSGDNAKTYYLYDPDNTVTASLKNESFVTNYLIKNTGDNPVNVNIVGVGSASGVEGVNAVAFTMTDQDLKIVNNGLCLPTTRGKYLAFVDNIANVTTDITRTTILVFLGLEKNPTTGVIEARFTEVSEVPKDLPVIFAKADGVSNLPATIGVDEDNSADANALAAKIRADASPLFMTGTAGQTVADVLTAALSGTTLSQNAGDYVFFLFDGTQFIAVNTSATSTLSGRRYLLAVDKLQLLRFLNDNGSAAARSQSATAPARRLSATDGVWAFPLLLGGDDATGIKSMDNGKWTMDNGDWYTIDGRKMNGRPAQKGVYIRNGQKVVIK